MYLPDDPTGTAGVWLGPGHPVIMCPVTGDPYDGPEPTATTAVAFLAACGVDTPHGAVGLPWGSTNGLVTWAPLTVRP